MAVAKGGAITVKSTLKKELEKAKGAKTWNVFLEELFAAWKKLKVPEETKETGAVVVSLGPSIGPALDVMKPWSMRITQDGITVEEIPHEKSGEEGGDGEGAQLGSRKGAVYGQWSFDIKGEAQRDTVESKAPIEVASVDAPTAIPRKKKSQG